MPFSSHFMAKTPPACSSKYGPYDARLHSVTPHPALLLRYALHWRLSTPFVCFNCYWTTTLLWEKKNLPRSSLWSWYSGSNCNLKVVSCEGSSRRFLAYQEQYARWLGCVRCHVRLQWCRFHLSWIEMISEWNTVVFHIHPWPFPTPKRPKAQSGCHPINQHITCQNAGQTP